MAFQAFTSRSLYLRSEMQAKMDGQETPQLIEGPRLSFKGLGDFELDSRDVLQGWQKYGKTLCFHESAKQNCVKALRFQAFLLTGVP